MDDITEVYVVEEYDLEEGEITDDGVVDVEETPEQKKKKLPKRYCLHQKKVMNERRKKDCKHSRHKVKNKDKSSPILNGVHKKHKSSCPLQFQMSSTGKYDSVTHIPPVNNLPNPFNNSSSSKSAFKNFASPPRPVQKFQNPKLNIHQDFDGIDNYPDLLLAYKKSRGHLDHKSKLNDYDNQVRHCSPKNSTKQKSSPKQIDTKQSFSEKTSPKKIESKQSLSDKSSQKKVENKQSLSEKASPIKSSKSKHPLHVKASPFKSETNINFCNNYVIDLTKSDNEAPFNESTAELELIQTQEISRIPKFEKRKEEESDDEEELRKIALATCVKRSMERHKASENINSLSNSPSNSLSNQSSVTLLMNADNGSSDNYEVVDMDLDDENFTQDLNVEDNLFVIDNNPIMSSEFKQDIFYGQSYMCDNSPTENFLPPNKDRPNKARPTEDFEEAILRAELIASINSQKKAVVSEPTISPAVKVTELAKKVENTSLQGQVPKPTAAYSKNQMFHPISANIKRTNVVKLSSPKLPNSKKIIAPKPRNINATQERLIITLNNDSSSDETDDSSEESNENTQENIVTGIDALISNARYKSDIKDNGTNLNHVSSLSKAQQEEYKKLRNILAEKEPMTIIPQTVREKSATGYQNLNFLTNKISVAKEKLDKEMEVLSNTEKDVLNQKKMYIASKLKFQHLQEQLHAAKLAKATNLKNWKVCEAKLVNAKSIVAKQKALISWLEAEFNSRRLQTEQNSSSPIL